MSLTSNPPSRWQRRTEPRRLAPNHFDILDRVAARITPDDATLRRWFATYWQQHRRRLAADLWIVEQHLPPGARILECGAVPLLMTGALAELGYDVQAVDIAPQRFGATIEALGLRVATCDIETEPLPFPDKCFDAVLFNELFEHLRIDPIATLGEVHRVLKPRGQLLLSTPNLRSFRGLRNLLLHNRGHAVSAGVYRQYEKLRTLGHMGHVREYTSREVADFLERIGLRVETIIHRGGHGRGLVGLAERLAPAWRPFFALIARKPAADPHNTASGRIGDG